MDSVINKEKLISWLIFVYSNEYVSEDDIEEYVKIDTITKEDYEKITHKKYKRN